jgi:hypothetical protein
MQQICYSHGGRACYWVWASFEVHLLFHLCFHGKRLGFMSSPLDANGDHVLLSVPHSLLLPFKELVGSTSFISLTCGALFFCVFPKLTEFTPLSCKGMGCIRFFTWQLLPLNLGSVCCGQWIKVRAYCAAMWFVID